MPNFNPAWRKSPRYGNWMMTIAAAIAFIVLLIDYFTPHGTIAHMWGTLVVLISTALMCIAALLIALVALPRWLVILFDILIILDIVCTGVCAYFLEAGGVLVLMIAALVGWIAHLGQDSNPVGTQHPWPASSKAR